MRTRAIGESALLLSDAIQLLRSQKIDYAIVGAMAASVHGVVRASLDADALLSTNFSGLAKLEQTFKAAGFKTERRRGDMDDPIRAVLSLHDTFENRVDLPVGIRGFDPEAFSRSIEVQFEGESLKFVCLEDFVAMKIFAGGPKGLDDAKGALQAASEPAKESLLRQLGTRYGPETSRRLDELLNDLNRERDSGLELGL